jgi:hypothetical protein
VRSWVISPDTEYGKLSADPWPISRWKKQFSFGKARSRISLNTIDLQAGRCSIQGESQVF